MASRRFEVDDDRLDDVVRALADDLDLQPFAANDRSGALTLLDTFDGRLVRDGGIVARTSGAPETDQLAWTDLDRDEDRGMLEVEAERRLVRSALPPGPVAARLGRVIDVRALLPLAHLRERHREFVRRDRRGKIVLRVRVDRERAVRTPGGRKWTPLPTQIQPIGLMGFERHFERAVKLLLGNDACRPTTHAWAIEALDAAGHRPGHDPSSIDVHLDANEPAASAVRRILREYLRVIRVHRAGARARLDPEFLHDLRVAVRRSRSMLKATRALWPVDVHRYAKAELRRLARSTSEPRDLDVYLLEFDDLVRRLPLEDRPHLEPVRAWLDERDRVVQTALAKDLADARTRRFLSEWDDVLRDRDPAGPAETRLGDAAARAIARAHARILHDGRAIDDASPAQALHDLRKRTKELRYLIDGFGPIFPATEVKRQTRRLKALQDCLGRHQDRDVQAMFLRAITHDLTDAPASTAMAVGYLVEQLDTDRDRLRGEFAAIFARYDAPKRRRRLDAMLDRARTRAARGAGA